MKENEEFFDPDLSQDNPVLAGITASESDALQEEDNISAAEEISGETQSDKSVSASPPKMKKFEIFGYDLKWCLGIAMIVIVLVLYALWPDPSKPNPASGPLVDPQQASATVSNAGEPPSVSTGTAAIPTADIEQIRADMTTLAKAQQQYSADNRQAISALARRLSTDEQELSALKAGLNAQSAQIGALEALISKRTAPEPAPHKALHRPAKRHPSTSTSGWSVNTIYPGMAWLLHHGSTWAVHAGDDVEGLHIDTIDAEHRVVITDHGIIR